MTTTPTRIGATLASPPVTAASLVTVRPPAPVVVVGPGAFDAGKIVLPPHRHADAQAALGKLDIMTATPATIVALGSGAERNLHQTLDGFLSRLDKGNAAPVFALFDRLEKGVEDADLPSILKSVQSTKPGLMALLLGAIRLKGPKKVAMEMYEAAAASIKSSTNTLTTEMQAMEGDLEKQLQKLLTEIEQIEALSRTYGDHFAEFAFEAAVAQAYVAKARGQVAAREQELSGSKDLIALGELRDLQNRLQLLESRALALEGTYTKLPTSALVIQQIRDAGVQTFQETLVTASSQFGDIKMTLLMIHGAFSVKSVQDLGARRAKLSDQLLAVQGQLMTQVVTSASNAAGDNRVAQAEHIKKAIEQAKAAQQIVLQARNLNAKKFENARTMFAAARDEIANLETAPQS